MRLGLFGKILIAFWLSLIGLGISISLLMDVGPSDDRPSIRFTKAVLAIVGDTLEHEGYAAAQRQVRSMGAPFAGQISITPVSTETHRFTRDARSVRLATTPEGQIYRVEMRPLTANGLSFLPKVVLWGSIAAGLVFSVALAYYLSRPIIVLRRGFQQLADGDLDVRIANQLRNRNDELADLALDFDSMAERLGMLITARDRLLNDVSHELRSPLARAQLALGLARQGSKPWDESVERVQHELEKLNTLVDELLSLAREESGAQANDDFFDPIWVAEKVIQDVRLESESRSVSLKLCLPNIDDDLRPVVGGNAALFARALENVIRNAIRFSPESSGITIDMAISTYPPQYHITVEDCGPGIAPERLDTVFEPFVRAGQTGVGLGLAITLRTVRALGGTIACHNRVEGGLAVDLTIPAISPPD